MSRPTSFQVVALALPLAALTCATAGAQLTYTPYFFDGYDVSANTSNINFETSLTRQGGVDAPINYLTTTSDPEALMDPSDSYKHQMFEPESGVQVLQLAEDGFNVVEGQPNPVGPEGVIPVIVSPDFNFNGTLLNGDIVGKRITFDLNVGAMVPAGDESSWTYAGFTVGGDKPLIDSVDSLTFIEDPQSPVSEHFSGRFLRDRFTLFDDFMQAYEDGALVFDNTGCVGCGLSHTGGDGTLSVRIDIDDPEDGNPWDGVGSTVIDVYVNEDQVQSNGAAWTYVRENGGFTDNFISFFGNQQSFQMPDGSVSSLATHTFDNFTVWSAPTTPPPPLAGDFNQDGVVDAADYTVWRDNQGGDLALPNDGGLGSPVGQAHYELWRSNYGQPSPAGLAATAAPEPGLSGLAFALLAAGVRRPRRK